MRQEMYGKPSVDHDGLCSVCGRRATNMHHVIPKGMGGVPRPVDATIPRIRLCGGGTTGCHGMAHEHKLHFAWDDDRGGWVYLLTRDPMDDDECWERFKARYRPLPGWVYEREETRIYGGTRR